MSVGLDVPKLRNDWHCEHALFLLVVTVVRIRMWPRNWAFPCRRLASGELVFLRDRLDGLVDEPRPGTPRTITDEDVERVVTMTLESKPKNATHWSTRSMAEAAGLSQTAIVRVWHAFGLQPHRTKTFKLSEDPLFIEKVRDIVGLYMNPPEHAIVLSIDEKSQVQALDRTQPLLPMEPWQVERQNTRLRTAWHNIAVCSVEHQDRRSDRPLSSASSSSRVLAIPQTC